MKKVLLVLTAAAMFAGCNNAQKEEAKSTEPTGDAAKKEAVKLAYMPTYSASFEMGNPEYAAMIVQGSWKDWETNSLDNMKNWITDTVVAFHSDNTIINGLDSMMARWKRGRAGYTKLIDSVHAVIPLYTTDKKENWVVVWAKEISTNTKGITDTVEIFETWRINKDGKADRLFQYDRRNRK